VNFNGNWLLGAGLVAILAHVYIFYGFESAGDVAEEVADASRRVPRAVISSLLVGGLTSFVLVAGLLLAIPARGQELRDRGFVRGWSAVHHQLEHPLEGDAGHHPVDSVFRVLQLWAGGSRGGGRGLHSPTPETAHWPAAGSFAGCR